MKVYLSSTYEDLRPHRAAVAAALRRMGHIVIGMEDYVAESAWPLDLYIGHIGECDVLVGIIVWRYGFVPAAPAIPTTPTTPGASPTRVSIVESEIQAAASAKKDVLMFLLDSKSEWPAHLSDAVSGAGDQGVRIADLRKRVCEAHVVAFFRTPEELAGLVVVALYRLEINRLIGFQSLKIGLTLNAPFRRVGDLMDTSLHEIQSKVAETFDTLSINIGAGTEWWSTRLYFLASLAADLLETAVIVFVDDAGQFIGMAPRIVKERLAGAYPPLRAYEQAVDGASRAPDLRGEVARRAGVLRNEADKAPGQEKGLKVFVTARELRGWFGDVMVAQALDMAPGSPRSGTSSGSSNGRCVTSPSRRTASSRRSWIDSHSPSRSQSFSSASRVFERGHSCSERPLPREHRGDTSGASRGADNRLAVRTAESDVRNPKSCIELPGLQGD